jgi:phosphoglycerate kinase
MMRTLCWTHVLISFYQQIKINRSFYFCSKYSPMKTVDSFNFSGQRALIRVDFNVPLDKQLKVTDSSRIKAAVPTIKKVLADGGSVVLMSHLGRPLKKLKDDGSVDYEKYSLKHTVAETSSLLGVPVKFAGDCIGEDAFKMSASLKPGEVMLLENLRFYKEEEKGNEEFASKLAKHGTVYINDAFGTAHRAHASTAIIAKNFIGKSYFGYVMASELTNADKVMNNAQRPFTAIMGGAKVSDKILIIEKLLEKVDNLLIGGAMAYTFFRAKGGTTGNSLVEEDKLDLAIKIMEMAKEKNVNLLLPEDSVLGDKFDKDAKTSISGNMEISSGWMGLDIGPKAVVDFADVILKSKTILWNGPMGVFEMPKFENGTKKIGEAVVEATKNGAFSLIGGGDSAAAVNQFNMTDEVSYVSTGGGALLEYFEGKELPGVKMILESQEKEKI